MDREQLRSKIKAFVLSSASVTELRQRAAKASCRSYLIGGTLRDIALFGKAEGDADVIIEAPQEQRQRLAEGLDIDVLPSENAIKFASSADFTVNSLLFDLGSEELLDPTETALRDLEQGVLAPLSLSRFFTSARKPLRLFKFSATLPLQPSATLLRQLEEFSTLPLTATWPERARVMIDLLELLSCPEIAEELESMNSIGLLPYLVPEATLDLRPEGNALPSLIELENLLASSEPSEAKRLTERKELTFVIQDFDARHGIRTAISDLAFLRLTILLRGLFPQQTKAEVAEVSAPEIERRRVSMLLARFAASADLQAYIRRVLEFIGARQEEELSELLLSYEAMRAN